MKKMQEKNPKLVIVTEVNSADIDAMAPIKFDYIVRTFNKVNPKYKIGRYTVKEAMKVVGTDRQTVMSYLKNKLVPPTVKKTRKITAKV